MCHWKECGFINYEYRPEDIIIEDLCFIEDDVRLRAGVLETPRIHIKRNTFIGQAQINVGTNFKVGQNYDCTGLYF